MVRQSVKPTDFYGGQHSHFILRTEFPKQIEAFEFVDGLEEKDALMRGQGWDGPRVFCEETYPTGRRIFIVLGREDIVYYLLKVLRPLNRHIYEIIRENEPVRLYLDLEYEKGPNSTVNGDLLVDIVVDQFKVSLSKKFDLDLDSISVLQLDSNSEKKYSQHLIFHTPKLFRNNRECGWFVKKVHSEIS